MLIVTPATTVTSILVPQIGRNHYNLFAKGGFKITRIQSCDLSKWG